jgi:hypothetical protein
MERKVTRVADLPIPYRISDPDFATICRISAVPTAQRDEVRAFLDETVTAFGERITQEQKLPTREADRRVIARAIDHLQKAQRQLTKRMGPAGGLGLQRAGRHIASAISVSWMQERFPTYRDTPATIYFPPDDRDGREDFRTPSRPTDVDSLSLHQRVQFMERRSDLAFAALIGDLADALERGRRAIVQIPTGRKPLTLRNYMLAGLAEIWKRLGRRPTSGATSQFGDFCECVFEGIGWPTTGVNSALAEAINLWRQRYG